MLPEIANYRDYRSGTFDKNVKFLERECLQAIMYKSQTIYWDKESPDCEERAKWLANSWSDLLVPVIGLIIFWWLFIGMFIFMFIRDLPIINNLIVKIYGYEYKYHGPSLFESSSPPLPKLQSGEDFQFKSSFDLLEGFKEKPNITDVYRPDGGNKFIYKKISKIYLNSDRGRF